MRIFLNDDPFHVVADKADWSNIGIWPAKWISCAAQPGTDTTVAMQKAIPYTSPENHVNAGDAPPFVSAYRLGFHLDEKQTIRFHITADERYVLYLDGVLIGRGSERGDAQNWYFETYEHHFSAGDHVLVARVWSQGKRAPFAQMTVYHGLIFCPDDSALLPLLATGSAPWEAKALDGYEFTNPLTAWGTGDNLIIHGEDFSWGYELAEGPGWSSAIIKDAGADGLRRNEVGIAHLMKPATLPSMVDRPFVPKKVVHVSSTSSMQTFDIPIRAEDDLPNEKEAWQSFLSGGPAIIIPAGTRRRVLVDLGNYYCAYPEAVTTGGKGAKVRINWQESLHERMGEIVKGNRSEYMNKYFFAMWHYCDGVGDTFMPDGGKDRYFETLWWQAGRWVEIVVETCNEPLILERIAFRETRYPLEMESSFNSSDSRMNRAIPIMLRGLQMCSHETYMDCPYYEQLQYIGDTRLEVLTTMCLTRDDRLPRKALRMFDVSRQLSGLTQSRYPTRVRQIIPTFSLWWVDMLYDQALWRGDKEFIASMMIGARGVMDYYHSLMDSRDLLNAPNGWNFVDWVPNWESGISPDGHQGVSAPINWQYAYTLMRYAEMEEWLGEQELAGRARRQAKELSQTLIHHFWDDARGGFADNLSHNKWSEHAQCMAILSGLLDVSYLEQIKATLLNDPDLERTTIYYTHYLFETFRVLNLPDALLKRLELWYELEKNGLKTTVEMPEPTRSDCHAWGAHPLYHYFATLLGIRPDMMGFKTVKITPQFGELTELKGKLVHPGGFIEANLTRDETGIHGVITLPDGVTGVFEDDGRKVALNSGMQKV